MSQASQVSLGIDVAKATFDAALFIDGERRRRDGRIDLRRRRQSWARRDAVY